MSIQIEEHVPIPERTSLPELPLDQMQPGQSFLLAIDNTGNTREIQALRQRVCRYQNRHPGTKFRVLKDDGGMRVFRID